MRIQIERFGGSLAELVDLLKPGRKLSALDIARVAEVPLNENTRPYEGTNAIK
jgi:hypothetical protein